MKGGDGTRERNLPLLLLLSAFTLPVYGDLNGEGEALLGFLHGLAGAARVMNWSNNSSPCSWEGVRCNAAQNGVETVKLPGAGLYGHILPGTLGLLSHLQTLSLRSNHLSGPLPADLTNCTQLRKLFLQNNFFSGSIPPFNSTDTPSLSVMDLSFNLFTGNIPPSISTLSLRILLLQDNSLSGAIPQDLAGLVDFNVSNNNLSGSIPLGLHSMPASSFLNNSRLCGPPLVLSCGGLPSPSPSESLPLQQAQVSKVRKTLSTLNIVLIVVADSIFVLLVCTCCMLWYLGRNMWRSSKSGKAENGVEVKSSKTRKADDNPFAMDSKNEYTQDSEHNKLVFFQGPKEQLRFDLEDLLRASAEVLGKGNFGNAYKATLEDGPTVVVKRLKDVSVGRKEFEQHMDFVGRIRHQHLVPLCAYYFSKEEKLLVHEYLPLGSLAAALHGPTKAVLDWETRLKIGFAAGKGLAHLHGMSSKAVHGNIKSSNVLLHAQYDASLSDCCITSLFHANLVVGRTSGYRAPEVIETRKVSQMSDVYSYGVVLLEMLTGKAPWLTLTELGMDLPRWVQSVVREEWTSEVFDKELLRYDNIEEEMVHMLQVALACVSASPSQRPSIQDALRMIASGRPSLLQPEVESSPPSSASEALKTSNDSNSNNPSPHHHSSELPETSTIFVGESSQHQSNGHDSSS